MTRYLDGLRDADYGRSYDELCRDITDHESLSEFTARQSGQPRLTNFRVESAQVTNSNIEVGADLNYVDGRSNHIVFTVVPGRSVGTLKVCGTTQ